MMQLARKVEPKDVISALGVLAVSLERIEQRGTMLPTELCSMIGVAEGLLDFRALLNVQKAKQVEELADELFELATEFINRARSSLLLESVVGVELSQMLICYGSVMNAALRITLLSEPAREQEFRVAMRWTK